ncbi:MAG: 30S ribosomal protein S9 [Armatimonadota bacterium]
MSEVSQNLTGQGANEKETEQLKETGVVIYHSQTKSRYPVMAKVCQGSGKVSVNGTSIDELMREGQIKRIEELLQVLGRERFKALDIDIRIGDSSQTEILSPSVLAYAIAEALTNLLGRL